MALGLRAASAGESMPASLPGARASVTVTLASLATTDCVIVTPSGTATQIGTLTAPDGTPITYEVVKASGSAVVRCIQKQTPAHTIDVVAVQPA